MLESDHDHPSGAPAKHPEWNNRLELSAHRKQVFECPDGQYDFWKSPQITERRRFS